jgi:ABC-2 type transport system permease protein
MATLPILSRVLRTRRFALTIWAASLAGVCGMYGGLYPMMEGMDLEAMIQSMPPAMVEALGYDDMTSAAGYVGSAVYGLVGLILLLVFGIGNGAGILAGREEDGFLELELTSPVSRGAIYTQRLGALWAQITVLVGIVSLVILVVDLAEGLAIPKADLAAATLQLWLVVGLFGSLAFAIGAATGRKGIALGGAAGVAVIAWMFNAIGPTVELDWMATVSPIGWYMDDNPLTRGFQPVDTLLLVGCACAVITGGWLRYRQRDQMT